MGSIVLHACFFVFAVVCVVGASGCAFDRPFCCCCLGPGTPVEPAIAPAKAEVEPGCAFGADDVVLEATRSKANAAADAGDATDAIVIVDDAVSRLTCSAQRVHLQQLRADVFERVSLKSDGPCVAWSVGWRARPDAGAVLDKLVAIDAPTRARLGDVVFAHVNARWNSADGVDSAVVAAGVERGLRERFVTLPPVSSSWTIEHVVDDCPSHPMFDSKLLSFGCRGVATVRSDDGAVWARAPLQTQIMGINVGVAVRNARPAQLQAHLAEEVTLRVLDEAEARLCGAR